MTKYDVEIAIVENETITGWDAEAVQDHIEAVDAKDAMDHAKDYLTECMINNGFNPEKEEIILRTREVIDRSCGDYGEWVYDDEM